MLRRKLKSNTGLSISIALLLFLVCAVIGSIVLAAATASAGRLSKLAESDRRYYNVVSAAEFLADELSGQSVTIVRTRVRERTETVECTELKDGDRLIVKRGTPTVAWEATYSTNINNNVDQPEDEILTGTGATPPVSAEGKPISLTSGTRSYLTAQAVRLMFGTNKCNTDEALLYRFTPGENADYNAHPLQLTHGTLPAGITADEIAVDCTCQLRSDGSMVLRVASDGFAVIVTLVPDVHETATTDTEGGVTPTVTRTASGFTETLVKTTTERVESSITWSVGSIRKEGASA